MTRRYAIAQRSYLAPRGREILCWHRILFTARRCRCAALTGAYILTRRQIDQGA